jgi:polar amino acid transport system substrate-binding protein
MNVGRLLPVALLLIAAGGPAVAGRAGPQAPPSAPGTGSSRMAPAPPAQGRVRVVTEFFAPYSFEEGGVVKGASTAVVSAALERAGVAHAIELMPWKRALDAARSDPGTLIYSVARTEDRERQLAWLGKICDRKLALYCLKTRADLLGRPLSELPDARFVLIQGDASLDELRQQGVAEARMLLLRDTPTPGAARHVAEGRSDFFVSNPVAFEHASRGTDLEGRFAEHSVLLQGGGYYLAAHPATDPALLERVRASFAALAADGTVEELFTRALRAARE